MNSNMLRRLTSVAKMYLGCAKFLELLVFYVYVGDLFFFGGGGGRKFLIDFVDKVARR